MKTLEQFRDEINQSDDFELSFFDTIEDNGWIDETAEPYGICNDGKKRLQFDSDMLAVIVDM